jgi:hypothetical protein
MENKPKNKPHSIASATENMNLKNKTDSHVLSLIHPDELSGTKHSPRFCYYHDTPPCIKRASTIAIRA